MKTMELRRKLKHSGFTLMKSSNHTELWSKGDASVRLGKHSNEDDPDATRSVNAAIEQAEDWENKFKPKPLTMRLGDALVNRAVFISPIPVPQTPEDHRKIQAETAKIMPDETPEEITMVKNKNRLAGKKKFSIDERDRIRAKIKDLRKAGGSAIEIAQLLTKGGFLTANGKAKWSASDVYNQLTYITKSEAKTPAPVPVRMQTKPIKTALSPLILTASVELLLDDEDLSADEKLAMLSAFRKARQQK